MEPEPDGAESGTLTTVAGPATPVALDESEPEPYFFHRIGGASVENLRLKPREAKLSPPGISVIKAATPDAAAREVRIGLPKAKKIHEQARVIGSARLEAIQNAGFDVIARPSDALPNHQRLTHPDGAAGFSDENLARLALAFLNTAGH